MDSNRTIFSAEETQRLFVHLGKAPYWTPAADQIEELESLLPKYLGLHPPIDDKPVTNLSAYGRQYFGVTENNRRLSYLNAFCSPERFEDRREKELILVKDGGSCYFQIHFDAAKKEFTRLLYNGKA